MRPKLLAVILLLTSALLACAPPASAMEVIQSFHSDIDVDKSGKLTVTETIQVTAENDKIRHGIYRDFPLTFTDSDGATRRVDFKLLGVTLDGQPENFQSGSIDNGIHIMIGKSDALVDPGEHIYEIKYETDRQIRYFPDHDELFWNVTGNGWEFPINEATATVTLPPGVRPEATVFYTGDLGDREKNARATQADGRVFFVTTRPLGLHQGLTIGVKFAKDAISPASSDNIFWWFIQDHRNTIIAGICLLLVSLYYVIQWYRIGRDPSRGVVVPRWDPPSGLSPALVNYVANRGFSKGAWTAFTASTISLAVKGLISLDDLKKVPVLKSAGKDPDDKLPIEERKIYTVVRDASLLAVNKKNGPKLKKLGDEFRAAIEKEHSGKYYRFNLGTIVIGLILTIGSFAILLGNGDFTNDMRVLLIALPVIFIILTLFTGILAGSALSSPSAAVRIIGWIFVSFFWLAFGVTIIVNILGIADLARSHDDLISYIAASALVTVSAFFTTIMGAATPLGRQLSDGIDGLRLYLTVAEKDRMNFAGAPEMSPTHFEKLLPYAVALGVEKPWSQSFQTWLLAAGATAAANYQPLWFGDRDGNFNSFSDRMSSLTSSLPSTIASALPAPPSSSSSGFSSSGGGSSGGGGGGGGGGGW